MTTFINYEALTHDKTTVRGNETLAARARVTSRPQGTIPGCQAPVHVKSLSEETAHQAALAKIWLKKLHDDVTDYRGIRQADKVARSEKLNAMIRKEVA